MTLFELITDFIPKSFFERFERLIYGKDFNADKVIPFWKIWIFRVLLTVITILIFLAIFYVLQKIFYYF